MKMEKWEIFSPTLTSLLDRQTSKFSLYLASQIFSVFIKLHIYLYIKEIMLHIYILLDFKFILL
jgi:hypothetical protein